MKTTVKSTDTRVKKQRRASGVITGVVILAILLFLLAGLSVTNEINKLKGQVADQKAMLQDSLDKSITAYMETKYLGTTNDNGRVTGDIDFTELTDEELQQILAAIMGSIDQYLTDDVYSGASKLAADELRASLNEAINSALTSMGLSSSTLADEISAIVLKNIQANLNEYKELITNNSSDISTISNTLYGIDTRVTNIDSSISGLQNQYSASIAALKKTDEQLATRIDEILKNGSTSQTEYNKQISELIAQMSKLQQTVNDNDNSYLNNYNQTLSEINNINNNLSIADAELASKIAALQDALSAYMQDGALTGTITPRTDGGTGNKLTLIVPNNN